MNIFETMQTITKLAKSGMTLELQEKIAELREQVVTLKEENTQLKEELQARRQELERYTKGMLARSARSLLGPWKVAGRTPLSEDSAV